MGGAQMVWQVRVWVGPSTAQGRACHTPLAHYSTAPQCGIPNSVRGRALGGL